MTRKQIPQCGYEDILSQTAELFRFNYLQANKLRTLVDNAKPLRSAEVFSNDKLTQLDS